MLLLLLTLLLLLLHSRAGMHLLTGISLSLDTTNSRQDLELGQARVSHLGCGRRSVQCASVDTRDGERRNATCEWEHGEYATRRGAKKIAPIKLRLML